MSVGLRLRNRLRRDLSRWLGQRPCRLALSLPIISFTFDDFPRSALIRGGAILRGEGLAGTYYASFGLMGQMAPTGEIFAEEDFAEFKQQGHELGCHTFDHCDPWETAPAEFEASILRNRRAVAALLAGAELSTLSYPLCSPRPQTKRRAAKYYTVCRGGGQTFNAGRTDLNLVKSFFIEQQREDFAAIQRLIDATVQHCGWLIFSTHDISDTPTRYGCTPALLQKIVRSAKASGALILPAGQAANRICERRAPSLEGMGCGSAR